jgi:HEAT repeat protein
VAKRRKIAAYISLLEKGDVKERRLAARWLGKPGAEAATQALIAALNDSDRFVRSDAARSLGKLMAVSAVPALAAGIMTDKSISVVRSAAEALGALGLPEATPALVAAAIQYSDHSGVQHDVKQAIIKIGPQSAAALAQCMAQDAMYTVSKTLLIHLHLNLKGFSFAGPSSVRLSPVLRALIVDEAISIKPRIAAVDLLLSASSALAFAGMKRREDAGALCERVAAQNPDPAVRAAAERMLEACSLLRASTSSDPFAAQTLLRAGASTSSTNAGEELMRPSSIPDANTKPIKSNTWWKKLLKFRR